MAPATGRYRDRFELFLQDHRPLMFRAFLDTVTPFRCERCAAAFAVPDGWAEEDGEVVCPGCKRREPAWQA